MPRILKIPIKATNWQKHFLW